MIALFLDVFGAYFLLALITYWQRNLFPIKCRIWLMRQQDNALLFAIVLLHVHSQSLLDLDFCNNLYSSQLSSLSEVKLEGLSIFYSMNTKRGWDKSPSLSIVFGLSSKTQWLSGLYYADFISFYSPTQLCGGGTTKSNSNEWPISVPLSF